MADSKALWRQRLRQQRQQHPLHEQQLDALSLSERVLSLPVYQQAQTIAAYVSNDGEINPILIVELALQAGKQVAYPVIEDYAQRDMQFYRYRPGDALQRNRYGLLEPDPAMAPCVAIPQIDLFLVPLLAFDHRGQRLGMGGGFYDRVLQQTKTSAVGLAYDWQHVVELPVESWDQTLDWVVTPSACYGPFD